MTEKSYAGQKSIIRSLSKYVAVFFALLIIINSILFYLVNRMYRLELTSVYKAQLTYAQDQINKQFTEAQSILFSLRHQEPLYKLLEYHRMTNVERILTLRDEILPYLDSLLIWTTYIDRVRILHADPRLPYLYDSFVYSSQIADIGYAAYLSSFKQIKDTNFYIEHLPQGVSYFQKLSPGIKDYIINLYLPLYSKNTLGIIALAQVSVKADMLLSHALGEQTLAFLLDEDGKLIWKNIEILDETYREFFDSDGYFTDKQGSLVFNEYNEMLMADVYKATILDSLMGDQILFAGLVAAAMLMVLLVGTLAIGIYKPFKRQLTSFVDSINQIRNSGDYGTRVPVSGQNELTLLSYAFNEMIANTEILMRRIIASGEAEKRAVYESLTNQIKPHFLNNALDTIRMMARGKGEKEIAHTLEYIMRYLSYNLGRQNMAVTLAVELENVSDYIRIYELSKTQTISLSMNIQGKVRGNLHNYYIPKFTLLPIVENCIHHGFIHPQAVCCIIIMIDLSDDLINIQVEDNGVGLDQSRLEELSDHLAKPEKEAIKSASTGIGLGLVYQRLKLFYGRDIPFTIESHPGIGTLVSFMIPEATNEELIK